MLKHKVAPSEFTENTEKDDIKHLSSVKIFSSAFSRVVPTEISKKIFDKIPMELTFSQKGTTLKESDTSISLNELIESDFDKILKNIGCAYNNYISNPNNIGLKWTAVFANAGNCQLDAKELNTINCTIDQEVKEEKPKSVGLHDCNSVRFAIKNKINWEQNTGYKDELNSATSILQPNEENKHSINPCRNEYSEDTRSHSPILPEKSKISWLKIEQTDATKGMNFGKELLGEFKLNLTQSVLKGGNDYGDSIQMKNDKLVYPKSPKSVDINLSGWSHLGKRERKTQSKINHLVADLGLISGSKSTTSPDNKDKSKKYKRLRKKLQGVNPGVLAYKNVDIISDTVPVNLSIMDKSSKEKLDNKKYNEIVDELTSYL